MRLVTLRAGFVAAILLWPFGAKAADYALILSNRSYDNAAAEPQAASYDSWTKMLRGAGFQVFGGQDWKTEDMIRSVEEFRLTLNEGDADRIIVMLSGRVVASFNDSWLLGREYRGLSSVNAGRYGLSLAELIRILETHQGHGLMVVAPSWSSREGAGAGLRVGALTLAEAQGVAVMTGPTGMVEPVVRDALLAQNRPLGRIARNLPKGVVLRGYLPDDIPLGRGGDGRADVVPQSDAAYWSAARDIASVEAYRAYLNRFPAGLFATEARRLIDAMENEPRHQAEEEENALRLTRDDRRQLQQDLSLLGFNTGGADGIFGRATRAAISSYQTSRGYADTSYLTAQQRGRIQREAAEVRVDQERQDRAYWDQTGAQGSIQGLRTYLDRYPNGIFSQTARRKLDEMDRNRSEEAAWNRAVQQNTIAGYRGFVQAFPNSRYVAESRDRIARLERRNADLAAIEKAKTEERAIAGNPVSRLMVEQALSQTGFDPGPVDGIFDNRTRGALKSFQQSTGLAVTGYVSQQTMVGLTREMSR
ncbi:peptidoglycan-binding protein [Thalassovita sp.]|uniref:peptidoglycan-binding protein n=1 Tax=Thalassovita sp. TaxID=1979401 RepID=UPI002B27606C|nr:peptidoglycan-binding protein [Thalassovita sp.]